MESWRSTILNTVRGRIKKNLSAKYIMLLEKAKTVDERRQETVESYDHIKSIYNDQIIEQVKMNLKIFEEKRQFQLPDVALLVCTNTSIISFVLNEHLNTTFTQYHKILRIRYITKQLSENKVFLTYSMDTLAAECGMKNRQVFQTISWRSTVFALQILLEKGWRSFKSP